MLERIWIQSELDKTLLEVLRLDRRETREDGGDFLALSCGGKRALEGLLEIGHEVTCQKLSQDKLNDEAQ